MANSALHYFSIIIPTYNRAEYLNHLLYSLRDQTLSSFEVIVCDDGSTDNTAEIISRHIASLDINYIKLSNSGGPAYPRNVGIKNAKYEWLCFLDSDDLWATNKLEILSKYLSVSKKMIYCHPVSVIGGKSNENSVIGKYSRGIFLSHFKSLIYNGSQVVNSSVCINKKFISKSDYFNTNKEYHGIEDYVFLLNLTNKGFHIRNIPHNLGSYRLHENNISINTNSQLDKLSLYFSRKPFNDCNYSKVNSFIEYLRIINCFDSRINTKSRYLRLIFSSSSLEIKFKSLYRLISSIH